MKLFVDKVRAMMPKVTVLDHIKHGIMAAARDGKHKYAFENRDFNRDLKNEIQWLEEQGFVVEVWTSGPCPIITVKW